MHSRRILLSKIIFIPWNTRSPFKIINGFTTQKNVMLHSKTLEWEKQLPTKYAGMFSVTAGTARIVQLSSSGSLRIISTVWAAGLGLGMWPQDRVLALHAWRQALLETNRKGVWEGWVGREGKGSKRDQDETGSWPVPCSDRVYYVSEKIHK